MPNYKINTARDEQCSTLKMTGSIVMVSRKGNGVGQFVWFLYWAGWLYVSPFVLFYFIKLQHLKLFSWVQDNYVCCVWAKNVVCILFFLIYCYHCSSSVGSRDSPHVCSVAISWRRFIRKS